MSDVRHAPQAPVEISAELRAELAEGSLNAMADRLRRSEIEASRFFAERNHFAGLVEQAKEMIADISATIAQRDATIADLEARLHQTADPANA